MNRFQMLLHRNVLAIIFIIGCLVPLQHAYSQGAIVNEMSNGTGGTKEFVELLVIGSSATPMGSVDLSGWIIDDNNGDFEGSGSGRGIASGHLRFAAGCFTAVTPGTLILIYNAGDPNVNLPALDPNDANADCIYVLSSTDGCIESCSALPISSNSAYTPCTYGAGAWTRMGLRNDGDAIQLRDPSATFFHGFSFGDVLAPFPSFPALIGGGSAFNAGTGSGSGRAYIYSCGDFTSSANYSKIAATGDTPGAANNAQNQYAINAMRNGSFDYNILNAPANCGSAASLGPCVILAPDIDLRAIREGQNVRLQWNIADAEQGFDQFTVERASSGEKFSAIGTEAMISGQTAYLNYDASPMQHNYYRIRSRDRNGNVQFSKVQHISMDAPVEEIRIFPNPSQGSFSISFQNRIESDLQFNIFNLQGQMVFSEKRAENQSDSSFEVKMNVAEGMYFLRIKQDGRTLRTQKLIVRR